MYYLALLVACVGLTHTLSSQNIQPPDMSLLSPRGLRMSIPHEDGITLFAVHYNINKPLEGVDPGDYKFDVTQPTGNEWVHRNPFVQVVPGDTVYFWHYIIFEGLGYQRLDQSWVATDVTQTTTTATAAPTPAPSTTTTTTTHKPSTTTRPTTPSPTPRPTTPSPTPRPTTPSPTAMPTTPTPTPRPTTPSPTPRPTTPSPTPRPTTPSPTPRPTTPSSPPRPTTPSPPPRPTTPSPPPRSTRKETQTTEYEPPTTTTTRKETNTTESMKLSTTGPSPDDKSMFQERRVTIAPVNIQLGDGDNCSIKYIDDDNLETFR